MADRQQVLFDRGDVEMESAEMNSQLRPLACRKHKLGTAGQDRGVDAAQNDFGERVFAVGNFEPGVQRVRAQVDRRREPRAREYKLLRIGFSLAAHRAIVMKQKLDVVLDRPDQGKPLNLETFQRYVPSPHLAMPKLAGRGNSHRGRGVNFPLTCAPGIGASSSAPLNPSRHRKGSRRVRYATIPT